MSKLLILLVLGIAGCASMAGTPVQTLKTGGVPGDDKVHSISAGEVIYSKFRYVTSPIAIVTTDPIYVSMGTYVLVPKPLVSTKMKNELAYCGSIRIRVLGGNSNLVYGCFFDANNDGEFETVMWAGSKTPLNDKTKYVKDIQARTSADGYKREILFQGRTEKTIKLKYREFINNMARPAYSQDIEYFIGENGTTSGNFRGLNIDVISIKGNYIECRVYGDIDQKE